jgi:hypothetical protein
MPEKKLDLGNCRTTTVHGLHVPVANDAINQWSAIATGERVLFESTLGSGNPVFPPIEVHTLSTGRTLLTICVHNGRFIERYKEGSQ